MNQSLEDASVNFSEHLREIAANYNWLLERCQNLEHGMRVDVDSILDTHVALEAPSGPRVLKVSSLSGASDEVLWNQGPSGFASPHAKLRMPQGEQVDAPLLVRSCWSERSESSAGLLAVNNSANLTRIESIVEPPSSRHSFWHGIKATDPNSVGRLIFECITVLVCLYDAIIVPFELAWDQASRQTLALPVLAFATVTFWWCEMGLNFFTGYFDQGLLVLDIRQTAVKYFSTWFILDLCINVVDSIILVIDMAYHHSFSSEERGPAFLMYLRMGKLNRLARIMVIFNRNRLQQIMRSLSLDSSNFTLLGLGMRLVVILFLLNHIVCCAWYWIGSQSGDTGHSWLDMTIQSADDVNYRGAPPIFQYLTALHWAFTQMTPGSMSVVPQNSYERAWNVLCLVLGLFVSSLLISQLSAKMVRVQTVNSAQLHQMETLGRFFVEHDVPRSLAQRIRRQVWERVSHKKLLTVGDLPSLGELPTSLRQELHGALFARSVLSNSVLHTWCLTHESLGQDLCFRVAEEEACKKDDELFVPGQEAKKVYFLQRGSMKYRREVPLASVASTGMMFGQRTSSELFPEVSVAEGEWISTVAMWCHWKYVGRLNTLEGCNVVTFTVEKMVDVLKGYPTIHSVSRSYASAYALMATSSENALKIDLDILPSRVMLAMPLDERVNFSVILLDSVQTKTCRLSIEQYYQPRRQRLGVQATKLLVEELEKGKCVVTLGKDHQLLRTVGLCVLDIMDSTGKVLVQIATKKQDEDAALDIALPATKMRESESNRQAAMRLIQTELPEMEGTLNFGEVLNEEHEMKSKHLGVRTMYLKTTYNASLWPEHFQDLRTSDFMPKLQVNEPSADWTRSENLGQNVKSSIFQGLQRATTAGESSSSTAVSEQGSMDYKSILAGATILAVKCKDKAKFYAWLLRKEFHQVKQSVTSNELELTAQVLRAYSTMERAAAENEDVESDDGGVEV